MLRALPQRVWRLNSESPVTNLGLRECGPRGKKGLTPLP